MSEDRTVSDFPEETRSQRGLENLKGLEKGKRKWTRKWVENEQKDGTRECCQEVAFEKMCSQLAGWRQGGWALQRKASDVGRLKEIPTTLEEGHNQS